MPILLRKLKKLKEQGGGDMMLYGGSNFVSNCMKENLIDEYNLFIHPVAIAKGMAPFAELKNLELIQSRSFSCGIALLQFKPKVYNPLLS